MYAVRTRMTQTYLQGGSRKTRTINDASYIFFDNGCGVWVCKSLKTGKIGEGVNIEEAYVCSLQAHTRALKHQEDYAARYGGDLGEMVLGKQVGSEKELDRLTAYPFNQLTSIMKAAATINPNIRKEKGFVYFSDTVKMAPG